MSKETPFRPKKILFISPNLGAGGAQRQTINIANGFHRRRYEVSVFLFYDKGELRNSLDENIKIFSPPSAPIIRKSKILWILYGIIHLFKTVLFQKPDILYSRHWPKMPMALIGRILGVKTVCGEGNNLRQTYFMKEKSLRFYARRLGVRLSDKVVANSESLAREVKEVFKPKSRVETIYNGIDIEDIRKRSKEEQNHEWFGTEIPVIIAVGSLKPQKGFSYLLQALEIVNRMKTVRLVIIGNGDRKELKDLSKKLSIEHRTDFLSAVANPFPCIAKADIFVCSSLYEGLSNVILEALALGKPIISTDHRHGANEIIEDRKSGILVPVENPQKIAETIIEILEDEEFKKSLGEGAEKRAENFSRDKMVSGYEKLFAEM